MLWCTKAPTNPGTTRKAAADKDTDMKANISTAQLPDAAPAESRTYRSRVVDYAIILKPRVMSLVVFTGLVGLLLAPGAIDILSAIITVSRKMKCRAKLFRLVSKLQTVSNPLRSWGFFC